MRVALSVWKQNRSKAKNQNNLNSLAAVINEKNVMRPALAKGLYTLAVEHQQPFQNVDKDVVVSLIFVKYSEINEIFFMLA